LSVPLEDEDEAEELRHRVEALEQLVHSIPKIVYERNYEY
jgi:hypothetical protein